MIVVDTNVIACLYLPGAQTAAARRSLLADPDWVAPYLWRSELRNVLATYLRGGHIALPEAESVMAEAERTMMDAEFDVDSAEVLALALESGASAYDCEYVALARRLKIKVLTSDRALLRRFPGDTVDLADA